MLYLATFCGSIQKEKTIERVEFLVKATRYQALMADDIWQRTFFPESKPPHWRFPTSLGGRRISLSEG